MTAVLSAVVVESVDPERLNRFWSELLNSPADGARLEFVPSTLGKDDKNRLHLDLASTSVDQQSELVELACVLGGRRIDIGQGTVPWAVMADPEGNEFCVLEPRAEYLGLGPIAAVVTDVRDPGAACRFWAAELDVAPARTHADYAALRAGGGAWLEFVRNSNPPKRQGRLHLRFEAPGRGKTGPRCPVCHGDSAELADGEGNRFCLAQMQEG